MRDSVDKINEFLFFDMPQNIKTDVAVAFGARSLSRLVAERAAFLYKENLVKKIIVTGGKKVREIPAMVAFICAGKWKHIKPNLQRDFLNAATEADYMKQILLEKEIPESDIVHEDDVRPEGAKPSEHFAANLENIYPSLKEFNTASFVTWGPCPRRLIETTRRLGETKEYPQLSRDKLKITTVPVYPYDIGPDNWHESGFLIGQFVKAESGKLDPNNKKRWWWPFNKGNYYDRGFCIPVDMEEEAKAILAHRWAPK